VQLPSWLGHILKSGEITLFTDDVKALELKAEDKKIDLNLIDKEFLRIALGSEAGKKSLLSRLVQLKNIARELKEEGLTMTVSYKGGLLLTIGSDANPKLSQLVTRTNAIEINNLRKFMEIAV